MDKKYCVVKWVNNVYFFVRGIHGLTIKITSNLKYARRFNTKEGAEEYLLMVKGKGDPAEYSVYEVDEYDEANLDY